MKTILFSLSLLISSSLWAEGLCYSSLQQSTMAEPEGSFEVSLESYPREYRHWLALKASMLVYNLPDLENTKNGTEFVQNYEAFIAQPVPGYEYWDYHSNRETGLKYAVLAPLNPSEPWIFAFAGSETIIDWLADLDLGRPQINKLESFIKMYLDCLNMDRAGNPIAGKNWIITGHSLGGGVAQIFAYKTQSLRMLLRLAEGRVELVSFNGFGAMELALPDAVAAEIVVPHMLTANYFVTGDVVSKIGHHVGRTFEIPAGDVGFSIIETGKRHLITTVDNLLGTTSNDLDLSATREVEPPYSKPVNALKGVGSALGFLTENNSDRVTLRLQHVNTLQQAVTKILKRNLNHPFDLALLQYLENMTYEYKANLESEVSTAFKDQRIEDLNSILRQIQRAR